MNLDSAVITLDASEHVPYALAGPPMPIPTHRNESIKVICITILVATFVAASLVCGIVFINVCFLESLSLLVFCACILFMPPLLLFEKDWCTCIVFAVIGSSLIFEFCIAVVESNSTNECSWLHVLVFIKFVIMFCATSH
jgi:hypothetical protein